LTSFFLLWEGKYENSFPKAGVKHFFIGYSQTHFFHFQCSEREFFVFFVVTQFCSFKYFILLLLKGIRQMINGITFIDNWGMIGIDDITVVWRFYSTQIFRNGSVMVASIVPFTNFLSYQKSCNNQTSIKARFFNINRVGFCCTAVCFKSSISDV
jgi:hypothetical protein